MRVAETPVHLILGRSSDLFLCIATLGVLATAMHHGCSYRRRFAVVLLRLLAQFKICQLMAAQVTVLLAAGATRDRAAASRFLFLTTVGNHGLLPLLFTPAEYPIKACASDTVRRAWSKLKAPSSSDMYGQQQCFWYSVR